MSYKVLVLIKPGDLQPAMERASEFARFMPDLEVVACRVVNKYEDEHQFVQLEESYKRELTSLFEHYPSIQHHSSVVLFNKSIADAFCEEASNEKAHYDLAIISANSRRTLTDLFVAPIDSQIMRKVKIPLLVVKDAHAPQRLGKAIVIAIDFDDDTHDKFLDEALFVSAKIFANHFNGEVHLLNCVPPIHRGIMSGNTEPSIVLGTTKALTRKDVHCAALYDFAIKHDVPLDHCHVATGRVDEMIPRVSAHLDARMVCMGTSTKNGVLGTIDPSAGELVLEQIKGDIFVVNKHFKWPGNND